LPFRNLGATRSIYSAARCDDQVPLKRSSQGGYRFFLARVEFGLARLLHDFILNACIPTATTAVALIRLSARRGKLALRFRQRALENRQRLYYSRDCDFKFRSAESSAVHRGLRLKLGRPIGRVGSIAIHGPLGRRRLFSAPTKRRCTIHMPNELKISSFTRHA
jgi:hypothetical protein